METRKLIVTALLHAALFSGGASFLRAQDAGQQEPEKKQEEPQKKEPVDHKKLKELLPETAAGVKRSNAEGSKQGYGEMKFAQAVGTYSEEGKESGATITIMDYGAMPGMFQGVTAWLTMEIDNDSDTQLSKTLTVAGYKAYLDWNKEDKSGHLTIAVGTRFTVEIRANGVEMETLQATAEAMKLKDLEALAK